MLQALQVSSANTISLAWPRHSPQVANRPNAGRRQPTNDNGWDWFGGALFVPSRVEVVSCWRANSTSTSVQSRFFFFPFFLCNEIISGWWLNQPIWKICSSNWIIFPHRGENKKYLKPTPRYKLKHRSCTFKTKEYLLKSDTFKWDFHRFAVRLVNSEWLFASYLSYGCILQNHCGVKASPKNFLVDTIRTCFSKCRDVLGSFEVEKTHHSKHMTPNLVDGNHEDTIPWKRVAWLDLVAGDMLSCHDSESIHLQCMCMYNKLL